MSSYMLYVSFCRTTDRCNRAFLSSKHGVHVKLTRQLKLKEFNTCSVKCFNIKGCQIFIISVVCCQFIHNKCHHKLTCSHPLHCHLATTQYQAVRSSLDYLQWSQMDWTFRQME